MRVINHHEMGRKEQLGASQLLKNTAHFIFLSYIRTGRDAHPRRSFVILSFTSFIPKVLYIVVRASCSLYVSSEQDARTKLLRT